MMMNTCYSFVDGKNVMHVASVHTYDAAQKTMVAVKGAGGRFRQGERARRHLRLGLGAEHLGRSAGLSRAAPGQEEGRRAPFFRATAPAKRGNMSQTTAMPSAPYMLLMARFACKT